MPTKSEDMLSLELSTAAFDRSGEQSVPPQVQPALQAIPFKLPGSGG
jgi:hypothetical protein